MTDASHKHQQEAAEELCGEILFAISKQIRQAKSIALNYGAGEELLATLSAMQSFSDQAILIAGENWTYCGEGEIERLRRCGPKFLSFDRSEMTNEALAGLFERCQHTQDGVADNKGTPLLKKFPRSTLFIDGAPLVAIDYLPPSLNSQPASNSQQSSANAQEYNMNIPLTAVTVLVLQPASDEILAAANNSVNFLEKIHPENISFDFLKNAKLIETDGRIGDIESLSSALSYEINRRINAGTWGNQADSPCPE